MQKKPFNPIRPVLILAVILKVAALIGVILATPYLPKDFAYVIIGILAVAILVQSRLILRLKR